MTAPRAMWGVRIAPVDGRPGFDAPLSSEEAARRVAGMSDSYTLISAEVGPWRVVDGGASVAPADDGLAQQIALVLKPEGHHKNCSGGDPCDCHFRRELALAHRIALLVSPAREPGRSEAEEAVDVRSHGGQIEPMTDPYGHRCGNHRIAQTRVADTTDTEGNTHD